MMSAGFAVEALKLVDSFEGKISNPSAFALQRGILLEAQRMYREAALIYIPLLADTTRDAQSAERRLLALLQFPASSEQVEATLLEGLANSSGLRGLKALTAHYLKIGRLDEALAFTLQLDSLQERDGQALLRFMRSCRERREYDLAIDVGKRTVELAEREFGRKHPEVADRLIEIACMHCLQHDYALAQPLFERALETFEDAVDEGAG